MDTDSALTASEVIDRVREARDDEHEAAVRQLHLAVHWALLHPCPDTEWPAHWGDPRLDEQVTPLAGEGAPLVAEFAPADLAAALDLTLDAGRQLIADALELVYRLPRLWALVVAGTVPVWRARAISRETHDLGPDAVAFADRLICATPAKIGLVDAARLVQEARLYFDPDRAIADEEHELTRRGVWLRHRGNPATTDVLMTPCSSTRPSPASPVNSASSVTPINSMSVEHGRSGSSPIRSTSWTSCPAATQPPPRVPVR
jgi:hypothetical protein